MTLTTLERSIVAELRGILKNPKFRVKDLMEWSNSESHVKANLEDGEIMVHVPSYGVWCAFAKEHDKRGPSKS